MRISLIIGLAIAGSLTASRLAAQAPDGKELYEKSCRSCHGVRGAPPAVLAKQQKIPTWNAAFMAGRSNDSLVAVMKHGGKNMKGFAGKLTPEEMAAVASYVKEMVAAAKPAP